MKMMEIKPWDISWTDKNCVVGNDLEVLPRQFWIPNWWSSVNPPIGFRKGDK
jgi:hypothetical protein